LREKQKCRFHAKAEVRLETDVATADTCGVRRCPSRGGQTVAVLVGITVTTVAIGCGGGTTPSSSTNVAHVRSTRHQTTLRTTRRPKPKPKPTIVVPSVIGQDEETARNELAASHLNAHFVLRNIALVCAEPAPGSTTTSQFPHAGDRLRAGAVVHLTTNAYVQTRGSGCGQASASRSCDPSELSLHITNGHPEFTGGGEVQLAGVSVERTGRGPACNVESTITFEIEQGGQIVSGVGGNPMSLQLHAALDPGDSMVAGWTLGDWCGSTVGVSAKASLEGLTTRGSLTHLTHGSGSCPALDMYSLYERRG
jgi:hypothetical protein